MKTKKEHDMTPSEIAGLIVPWAETLDDPIFNNRMAYDALDCIGEPKDVSDALRYLFTQGKIARKKMDAARYAYALIDKAPVDFERAERLVKEPAKKITNDHVLLKKTESPFLTLHLADGKLIIPDDQESPTTAKQESGKLSAIDVCKDGLLEKIEMIEETLHLAKAFASEGQLILSLESIADAATQAIVSFFNHDMVSSIRSVFGNEGRVRHLQPEKRTGSEERPEH
jgi:hypothetical protein